MAGFHAFVPGAQTRRIGRADTRCIMMKVILGAMMVRVRKQENERNE
jgi:hypothetical protein